MLELMELWNVTQVWVMDQINNNDFFAGFVGASILVPIFYYLRGLPPIISKFLYRQFTVRVSISNNEESFYYLGYWLQTRRRFSRFRNLRLTSPDRYSDSDSYIDDEKDQKAPLLQPGVGWHWFFYGWRLVVIQRNLSETQTTNLLNKEDYNFVIFGRNPQVFQRILEEATAQFNEKDKVTTRNWVNNHWRYGQEKDRRPIETIFLPAEQKARIIKDLTWFYESRAWYQERGIPYHRGYLFHGEPGTGKTSLTYALASHFKKTLFSLSLTDVEGDKDFLSALAYADEGIILLEDIDVVKATLDREIMKKEGQEPADGFKGLSLAGILNGLDGVMTPDDCVIIMTTNHAERLDPALIRSGRVDLQEEIKPLEKEQVQEMVLRFFNDKKLADKMAARLKSPIPGATLQGLLIQNLRTPGNILDNLPSEYFS